MRRNKAADNTGSLPAMTNSETPGYYTDGTPGTLITADEMNIIQEELVAIATMKGASLDNSGANLDQCAEALDAVLAIETDVTLVSNTTCVNKRMIAVSSGATASGNHSAVIASKKTTTNNAATGAQSAVIASDESVASGDQSAVLASSGTTQVSGDNAAAIAAVDATVTGAGAALIATAGDNSSTVSGDGCASLASDGADVDGKYNASIASTLGAIGGATTANQIAEIASNGCTAGDSGSANTYRAANIAADGCNNDGLNNCAIIGSEDCDISINSTEGLIAASELCNLNSAALRAAVIASYDCDNEGDGETAIIGSRGSNIPAAAAADQVVMLASYQVTSLPNTADGDVVGGYNTPSAGANIWRIDGSSGTYYGAGGAVVSGADYAEMFENGDGVAHPPGRLLSRRGRASHLGQRGDRVLGIVSARPTVVGNDSDSWHDRYVTDKWGRVERNDDGRTLKQRPSYDPTRKQIMRRDRPDEWTCVGLVGQLRVAIDDTVTERTERLGCGRDGVATRPRTWWKPWTWHRPRPTRVELMEIVEPFDEVEGHGVALVFIR